MWSREPLFAPSTGNSLRFVALAAAQAGVALVLAAWLRWLWPDRLPTLLTILLLLPAVLSRALLALIGRLFFHDQVGLGTRVLRAAELIGPADAPLGTPAAAWVCLVVLDSWQWVPFTALLFWVALGLPARRTLEVARVDGLNHWQVIRRVVLPVVAAPLAVVTLLRLLEGLRTYDLPEGLTGGGPGVETMTASIFANRITFLHQRYGVGAAHLVVLELTAYALIVVLFGRVLVLRETIRGRAG